MSELREKIEVKLDNFFKTSLDVDRSTYFNNLSFYTAEILTAIEESIKNCHSCWGLGWVGNYSHQVQCKECGGKGWVMK